MPGQVWWTTEGPRPPPQRQHQKRIGGLRWMKVLVSWSTSCSTMELRKMNTDQSTIPVEKLKPTRKMTPACSASGLS